MSDSLMKNIIEAAPKLDDEIFHELVDATWKERVRRRDGEDQPDFPAFEEITYGLLTEELHKGKKEFLNRLDLVCEALGTENRLDALTGSYSPQVTFDTNGVHIFIGDNRITLGTSLATDLDLLDVFIALGLKDSHLSWDKAVRQSKDLKHPLAPLIEAWFNLPRLVEPVQKRTGIAPRFGTMRDTRGDPSTFGQLPDLVGSHGQMTSYLPGFEPPTRKLLAAPTLELYDRVGGQSLKKGRAAPHTLRLFFELLMAIPLEAREYRSDLSIPLRDLRDWFYPAIKRRNGRTRSSYEPGKHLHLIQRAIREVHNLSVEVIPEGEKASVLWQPITARAIPTDDLDSIARFEILMPPGSTRGALVDRHIARILGMKSAIHYRAYISLSYFWDYYGRTEKGRRSIKSTRPIVARNGQGLLLNRAGETILDRTGKPSSQWKRGVPLDANNRPTDWKHASREVNPTALSRYPVLNDDNILDLCYSLSDSTTVNGNAKLQRLHRAKVALREMENENYIVVVEDAVSTTGNRKGWHILPV